VAQSIWESAIGEDASKKTLRSCNKPEKRFCAKEGRNIPYVNKSKSKSERICRRTVKEGVY